MESPSSRHHAVSIGLHVIKATPQTISETDSWILFLAKESFPSKSTVFGIIDTRKQFEDGEGIDIIY